VALRLTISCSNELMNRWFRRLHTFLSVFFSPLLMLFVITGWWQTVTVNRNKALGFGSSWIEKLSTIHVDNYFPLAGAHNYSTDLFKVLVVIMCIGFIFSTLLGLLMAFRFTKRKVSLVLILIARLSLRGLGTGSPKASSAEGAKDWTAVPRWAAVWWRHAIGQSPRIGSVAPSALASFQLSFPRPRKLSLGILVPIALLYLGEGAKKSLRSPVSSQSVQ